jgi:hypothetical protein
MTKLSQEEVEALKDLFKRSGGLLKPYKERIHWFAEKIKAEKAGLPFTKPEPEVTFKRTKEEFEVALRSSDLTEDEIDIILKAYFINRRDR